MRKLPGVAVAAAALMIPALGFGASSPRPVMTGLDNPRGLAWGPEGGLYVAEAGRGGPAPCVPAPDAPPPAQRCYGATGAVSRLWHGVQERVITGLPSIAFPPAGDTAAGPQHVSFQGRGGLFITIGCGCNKATPPGQLLDSLGFGYLLKASASGNTRQIANIAGYEVEANPDGGLIDSNPYGLVAQPAHRVVTDAGGNSLVDVSANGDMTTVATFPKAPLPGPFGPRDAVPTGVVVGPDGAYYVSTLTGVPFIPGTASVYRVVPGQAPTLYAWNLSALTDLAFGSDGSLYVLRHGSPIPGVAFPLAGPGAIWVVPPGGGGTSTLVADGLPRATGLVVGADGALYVSVNGASAGNGAVWRITP
ncbi:MAG TPA: ScyD/ScyE family protein [Gaiellaceae bacterium]|nr:ScyD/ScyE family protein [Gaiellaceae bacterium]